MSVVSIAAKEAIALHYMKLNSEPGSSVESLRALYVKALETLASIESREMKERIDDSKWSL